MNPHLTEQQIYDLLSSDTCEDSRAEHLATCTLCRDELANLRFSLANFGLAAKNLSHLHTPPRPAIGRMAYRSFFALPERIWASGLASILAISTCSAIAALHLHQQAVAKVNAATATTPPPVSDEALLQDIDRDLSTSVPPSLQPLDTTIATTEPASTSTSN